MGLNQLGQTIRRSFPGRHIRIIKGVTNSDLVQAFGPIEHPRVVGRSARAVGEQKERLDHGESLSSTARPVQARLYDCRLSCGPSAVPVDEPVRSREHEKVGSPSQLCEVRLVSLAPLNAARFRQALALSLPDRDYGSFPDAILAGVMLIVLPEPARVLAIARADTMKDHPGEVAFPGGKVEGTEGVRAAAFREVTEEVGVQPSELEYIGELQALPVITAKYVVHPVLALAEASVVPKICSTEIDELLEIELLPYLTGERRSLVFHGEWRGRPAAIRHFQLSDRLLYGARAAVLYELLERLALSYGIALPEAGVAHGPPWGRRYADIDG